jgi:hypothetical protein
MILRRPVLSTVSGRRIRLARDVSVVVSDFYVMVSGADDNVRYVGSGAGQEIDDTVANELVASGLAALADEPIAPVGDHDCQLMYEYLRRQVSAGPQLECVAVEPSDCCLPFLSSLFDLDILRFGYRGASTDLLARRGVSVRYAPPGAVPSIGHLARYLLLDPGRLNYLGLTYAARQLLRDIAAMVEPGFRLFAPTFVGTSGVTSTIGDKPASEPPDGAELIYGMDGWRRLIQMDGLWDPDIHGRIGGSAQFPLCMITLRRRPG